MSADYEKRGLVIIGDEAWTPEEYEAAQARTSWERGRYQRDPKRREQVKAAVRRWQQRNPEKARAYKRAYKQREREVRRHLVGSLHDGQCTGPTRATGCRCHKIKVYDKPGVE